MAEYDGSFKLGVELDTTQAKKDLENFIKTIDTKVQHESKSNSANFFDSREVVKQAEKTGEQINKTITKEVSNVKPQIAPALDKKALKTELKKTQEEANALLKEIKSNPVDTWSTEDLKRRTATALDIIEDKDATKEQLESAKEVIEYVNKLTTFTKKQEKIDNLKQAIKKADARPKPVKKSTQKVKDVDIDGTVVFGKQAQKQNQQIEQTTLQLKKQIAAWEQLKRNASDSINRIDRQIESLKKDIISPEALTNPESISKISDTFKQLYYDDYMEALEKANKLKFNDPNARPGESQYTIEYYQRAVDNTKAKLNEARANGDTARIANLEASLTRWEARLKSITQDYESAMEEVRKKESEMHEAMEDVMQFPEVEVGLDSQEKKEAKINDLLEKRDTIIANTNQKSALMQEGIQQTTQKLQQQKGAAALAGNNTKFGQILGIFQSGSLKGIIDGISTALIALPEPLTTTLGIIIKIAGVLTIIQTILAPIKKAIQVILGILKKVFGIVFNLITANIKRIGMLAKSFISLGKGAKGFGNIFQNVFKRIFSRLKNIVFYNVLSKQIRELTETFSTLLTKNEQVKKSLGQIKGNLLTAFAPIYSFVLPAIQRLLSGLVQLSQIFARFTSGLFGKTTKQSQALAQSLEDQAKAAGGANKSLAGFDELNNLSSGGGGVESVYEDFKLSEELEALLNRLTVILQNLWKPFKDSWDKYAAPTWEIAEDTFYTILDLLLDIGETFSTVWNDGGYGESILGHLWESVQNILNGVKTLAGDFKDAWDIFGTSISENVLKLFDTLAGHVETITEKFKDWSENINFRPLLNGIDKITKALAPFADTIGEGLEQFLDDILFPFGEWLIEKGIPAILELAGEMIQRISDKLKIFNEVMKYLWDNYLKDFINRLGDALIKIINSITSTLNILNQKTDSNSKSIEILKNVIDIVMSVFQTLWTILEIGIGGPLSWLMSIFRQLPELIVAIVDKIGTMAITFDSCKDDISKAVQRIKTLVEGIGDVVKNVTDKAKSWVSNMLNSAKDWVIDKVTIIINWVQKIIDKVNEISGAISGAVGSFSTLGSVASANLSIDTNVIDFINRDPNPPPATKPKTLADFGGSVSDYLEYKRKGGYAKGTVIPPSAAPFYGLLGDNNQETEVVSPLSTMKQAMIEALNEGGLGGSGTFHIHVDVDGREIANTMVQQNDIYKRRTGRSLLV